MEQVASSKEEAPRTPTSETKSVRSEMSSRRLREMERRQKSSTSREPLRLSGRKSSLFCTPPSLCPEPETTEQRSDRVRREASERMKREKIRLSTMQESTQDTEKSTTSTNTTQNKTKPPTSVVLAAAPLSKEKESFASAKTLSLASDFEAVCFITGNDEHEAQHEETDKADSIHWPPNDEQSTLSPQNPPFPGAWSRALVDLECSPTETEANTARDSLIDKIVWVHTGNENMCGLAARVKAVVKQHKENSWLLGLELMSQPGRTIFLPPTSVTLLSMRELMELPPPPPPLEEQASQQNTTQTNDENAPPSQSFRATSENSDDTPPALRPNNRIPDWANTHSDALTQSLKRQQEQLPPKDFISLCNGAARTCDLAKVFRRPSLARAGYRETGDWSKDDW